MPIPSYATACCPHTGQVGGHHCPGGRCRRSKHKYRCLTVGLDAGYHPNGPPQHTCFSCTTPEIHPSPIFPARPSFPSILLAPTHWHTPCHFPLPNAHRHLGSHSSDAQPVSATSIAHFHLRCCPIPEAIRCNLAHHLLKTIVRRSSACHIQANCHFLLILNLKNKLLSAVASLPLLSSLN